MVLHLLPAVIGGSVMAWNGMVNALNDASGRTIQKNLEGQRLAHQKELQEKQIVAQLKIEYMRTMSQIKLQQNNQEFQLYLQQNNQQFQQKLEIASQEFQAKIVEYQCQENQKLQEFITVVDMQIAKSNLEFQAWLFQQQKQVQIELAQYNRESQFMIAGYQREAALEIKELEDWPIKIFPWHILEYHQGRNPIPVQIILAPPEIDFDRFEHQNTTSISGFPKVEKRLYQYLKNFLQKHYPLENQQRPTELIDHTWDSNRFAGGSAVKTIFSRLKSEPILLIESEVDGDLINIQVAYWSGGQEISPFYKTIISHLHYPKILYEFAIQRALDWDTNVRQKLLAQGRSEQEINQEYGGDNLLNLQIYRKFEQDKLAGIEFERHYKTNSEDFGKFSALLGAYYNIIVALFADIHYLINTNLSPKLPELLPELKTEFSIDRRLADDLFKMVVESYIGSLRAMEKDRSELVPEFAADIALGLTRLSNPTLAEQMLDFSLESWLNSRYISVDNGREKFDIVAENLLPLDEKFITKINRCLVGLAKEKKLSLIDSCYRRAIEKFNLEKYQEAIIDFGYAIDLNPEFADGYYQRGLTYIQLTNYPEAIIDFGYAIDLNPEFADSYYRRGLTYIQLERYGEAVEDLTQVVRLDASHAPAYNYRGSAYYKLGEYQQAVDDYDRAINLGLTEAVKNRDILLNVWEEIKRQAEEKIRREERERKLKGELFTFEVITVNNSGKIINRTQGSARQKIEDLGNGIKLEMVYIPRGSFLMQSPEDQDENTDAESLQHQVTLQPFYMSKYPITQTQYQVIMGNNPSNFIGRSRPVERVSWHDATKFCQKLSEKTGKIYTLPSESQWEYACRAGTTTPFSFGETITSELVNYDGNYPYSNAPKGKYRQETTDVGTFPPNAFGLYDMHGNVWEWCLDVWHDNYNGAPTDGNAWESGGDSNRRVLRGGSWYFNSWDCRSAWRIYYYADDCINTWGFRIVSSGLVVSAFTS